MQQPDEIGSAAVVRHSSPLRRLGLAVGGPPRRALGRVMGSAWLVRRYHRLPTFVKAGRPPPPWPEMAVRVPEKLLTQPGIRVHPKEVETAAHTQPLRDYLKTVYPTATAMMFGMDWPAWLLGGPAWARSHQRARKLAATKPSHPPRLTDPAELTRLVKARAKEIGLSTIGVAELDTHYTFQDAKPKVEKQGSRVIVCIGEVETAWTEQLPSERAKVIDVLSAGRMYQMTNDLVEFLIQLGYRATPYNGGGVRGISLKYAVQAGLGQLGRQGLLLTPFAGPRLKIDTIQTDAPLVLDRPVDYGIPKLCDACMVCVRNCPANAIPLRRTVHRGVEKAKINTSRCMPTVWQGDGCSICIKVCPIQKYGLQPVIDEFEATGRILGKDTDELEGYDWIDGNHYGPNSRPTLPVTWFAKPEYQPIEAPAPVQAGSAPDQELPSE